MPPSLYRLVALFLQRLFLGHLGMKIAKLEIKMILVLVLSRYEYKLVDAFDSPQKNYRSPIGMTFIRPVHYDSFHFKD